MELPVWPTLTSPRDLVNTCVFVLLVWRGTGVKSMSMTAGQTHASRAHVWMDWTPLPATVQWASQVSSLIVETIYSCRSGSVIILVFLLFVEPSSAVFYRCNLRWGHWWMFISSMLPRRFLQKYDGLVCVWTLSWVPHWRWDDLQPYAHISYLLLGLWSNSKRFWGNITENCFSFFFGEA